ncbi:hypothetical protein CRG98_023023 [Punica granatum]|uniref:Uncharacterized protein n=1 Tax=Punica granatum TaxID=22663 RepID=A0A2I0JJY4_PUNGR|nr:hypothetical protein CRG98_023023 [Punica granatum]
MQKEKGKKGKEKIFPSALMENSNSNSNSTLRHQKKKRVLLFHCVKSVEIMHKVAV